MDRDNEGKLVAATAVESAEEPAAPAREGESLLELLLAEHQASAAPPEPPARIDGVVVGVVVALEASGAPRVAFPGAPEGGLVARGIAALTVDDIGRDVALLFEGGDPTRPLVMGKMHAPNTLNAAHATASPIPRPEVQADNERIEITAEKEIVLSCGKASITLTRAGKILISGEYVLSRSSGVHRIQGGSVQIN